MKYFNLVRNVENWPTFISFKLGLNNDNPLKFKLKPTPIELTMSPSMKPLFGEIFMTQVYEPALQSITKKDPTIIDVGGNMGYFALYSFLRKPEATIHSFEPVPTNYGFLQNNKRTNAQFNWHLYNNAVSDQDGEHDFYYDANYSPEGVDVSASLFSPEHISTVNQNHSCITVEVLGLSAWMQKNNITNCDLLKLDCEGAEYNIVYSLTDQDFQAIRYIVADVHPMKEENENIDALDAYLHTKGYQVDTVNQEILYAKRIQA
jgi:FkbM family methyltransferase